MEAFSIVCYWIGALCFLYAAANTKRRMNDGDE